MLEVELYSSLQELELQTIDISLRTAHFLGSWQAGEHSKAPSAR